MLRTQAQRAAQERMNAEAEFANEVARQLATFYFQLHEVCDLPACRRARRCVGEGLPPCILDKKAHYMHLLPELRALLMTDPEAADAGEDMGAPSPDVSGRSGR